MKQLFAAIFSFSKEKLTMLHGRTIIIPEASEDEKTIAPNIVADSIGFILLAGLQTVADVIRESWVLPESANKYIPIVIYGIIIALFAIRWYIRKIRITTLIVFVIALPIFFFSGPYISDILFPT